MQCKMPISPLDFGLLYRYFFIFFLHFGQRKSCIFCPDSIYFCDHSGEISRLYYDQFCCRMDGNRTFLMLLKMWVCFVSPLERFPIAQNLTAICFYPQKKNKTFAWSCAFKLLDGYNGHIVLISFLFFWFFFLTKKKKIMLLFCTVLLAV